MYCKPLLLFLNNIVSKMADNPDYPMPSPSLAELIEMLSILRRSIAEANNGDRFKIAFRDQKKKEVIKLLDQLAIYVKSVGKENINILLSSGFHLRKANFSKQVLGIITNAKFKRGKQSGQIVSQCDAVKNAKAYNHFITPAPATSSSQWTVWGTTSIEHVFDVTPGQEYVGYITAIGTDEQVSTSKRFTIMAS